MGMDAVELVMALEDVFDVEFGESEAEACRTPRHLIGVIAKKVRLRKGPALCLSQATFHRLRRALRSVLGTPRCDIRLSAALDGLLPTELRQTAWYDIRKSLQARHWPALVRPKWVACLVWLAALFAALVPAYWIVPLWAPELLIVLCTATLVVGAVAGFWLTRRFRVCFPSDCRTVRQLVRHLLMSHVLHSRDWTLDEITVVVRNAIEMQTGETGFTLDSDFIRDIGLC